MTSIVVLIFRFVNFDGELFLQIVQFSKRGMNFTSSHERNAAIELKSSCAGTLQKNRISETFFCQKKVFFVKRKNFWVSNFDFSAAFFHGRMGRMGRRTMRMGRMGRPMLCKLVSMGRIATLNIYNTMPLLRLRSMRPKKRAVIF